MKELIRVKIQSVSDVITNSSSEVYMIIDRNTVSFISNLINGLFGKGASDLFNIQLDIPGALRGAFDYSEDCVNDSVDFWTEKKDASDLFPEQRKKLREIVKKDGDIRNFINITYDEDEVSLISSYNMNLGEARNLLYDFYMDGMSPDWQDCGVDPGIIIEPKQYSQRLWDIAKQIHKILDPTEMNFNIRQN